MTTFTDGMSVAGAIASMLALPVCAIAAWPVVKRWRELRLSEREGAILRMAYHQAEYKFHYNCHHDRDSPAYIEIPPHTNNCILDYGAADRLAAVGLVYQSSCLKLNRGMRVYNMALTPQGVHTAAGLGEVDYKTYWEQNTYIKPGQP